MFRSKRSVSYLSINQIAPIIEEYLISKNPFIATQLEGLDENGKIAILASTPQWTYLQIIDQYLVCQLGKKQYDLLLRQQEILGVNILPPRFSPGILFVKKFYEFLLHLRQLDESGIKTLLDQARKLPITDGGDELAYLKKLIRLIQEYELKTDNPNYQGKKHEDEAIKEQLDDNEDLFNHYLSYRPELLN